MPLVILKLSTGVAALQTEAAMKSTAYIVINAKKHCIIFFIAILPF
jgi:hypothetical protein